MASRDQGKAEEARRSILGEIPGASVELQPLDLASLAAVREAVERILRTRPDIDVLVNNAGVMGIPERRTEDGFEMQLAVNHLGHFAHRAAHACPAPKPRHPRRLGRHTGRHNGRAIDPENPHLEGRYDPWRAYGQSKLANVHFALELDRRCRAADVAARASSSTRGSRTPICKPEACGKQAAAGASGSFGRPWSGSAPRRPGAHSACSERRRIRTPSVAPGTRHGG
jgi:NAD(P)-dependent dehydrogenase (short-subunit alcohol dehydrogenase family)